MPQSKDRFDTIIVGAGPAGLFAACELLENDPKHRICLVDKGKLIQNRTPKDVMCGVGGSGSFSDGKLHFTPILSHEKMFHLYTREEYQKMLDQVDTMFTAFGVTAPYFPSKQEAAQSLIDLCRKNAIDLAIRRVRHIGSDALVKIIQKFQDHLISHGVTILPETEVKDIITEGEKEGTKTCGGVVLKGNTPLYAKNVLLAPGRVNTKWMQRLCEEHSIGFLYDKIEIGVRVEFPSAIMQDFAKVLYEPVFLVRTPTFDDVVRSFCPCPNGYVSIERYDGFVSVNGHSNAQNEGMNSNFAFVSEINLTEPVENTTSYALSIAKMASTIGGGKPILQRLFDLRNGQRSSWDRIRKSYVNPSLDEVTPGDISMALPYRTLKNIVEGLEILDRVMPGINAHSTLLYAPEIKLRSSKVSTDKHLRAAGFSNLYVAGDAAGVSGCITGAAVTGLTAARGILE